MKKRTTICQIAKVLFITLILALPVAAAKVEPRVTDHEYYQEKLKELKKSTARIQAKVDRIVKEFKRNLEVYYRLTGRTRGIPVKEGKEKHPSGIQTHEEQKATSQPMITETTGLITPSIYPNYLASEEITIKDPNARQDKSC